MLLIFKKRYRCLILIFLLVLPINVLSVEDKSLIERHEKQIVKVRKKIKQRVNEYDQLESKEFSILEELDQISFDLNSSILLSRKIEKEKQQIERRLVQFDSEYVQIIADIEKLQSLAAKRLVYLYKINRLGLLSSLFSSKSFFDFWKRTKALSLFIEEDENFWQKLKIRKLQLEDLSATIETNKNEKEILLKKTDEERKIIISRQNKRKYLLEQIRNDKNLLMASIESLKNSAAFLEDKIKAINAKFLETEQSKNNISFQKAKGLLPMPVEGEVTSGFDSFVNKTNYDVRDFLQGVSIKALPSSKVKAVFSGKVVYASWLRGYGNIVIVDHGENFYTLSAQIEEVLANTGDQVNAGATIGILSDGGVNNPILYFEIRHHAESLDPKEWFNNE